LEKEGPNDGLVSVESSKWVRSPNLLVQIIIYISRQGTYLGTLSDVNHLDLVGWINTARYKWAEIMGKEIKFRPATFYLGIVDMLAGEVEGVRDEREGEVQEALRDARGENREHEQVEGGLEGRTQAGEGAELKETS
jgi:triacylglycerol lipase